MEDKILQAIRETLPEKEVGIVKKVFEERDKYKTRAEELEKENDDLSEELFKFKEDKLSFESKKALFEEEKKAFKEKEKDILEKERAQKEEIAKVKYDTIKMCFDTVLGNTVIRKRIQKSVPMKGEYGIQHENEITEEEVTEE